MVKMSFKKSIDSFYTLLFEIEKKLFEPWLSNQGSNSKIYEMKSMHRSSSNRFLKGRM